MSLAALRQQLAVLVPPPRVGPAAIPTGVAAIDRALSTGGLPRGRLTEILGRPGSGRTTLTRQLVAAAIADGRWVAYVDGTRTLSPRDWTTIAGTRRLWIIRPPNANRVAWCADILLRSGAFGLVVLDGGPSLPRPVALRLTRLARDHDAALVIAADESPIVGSAVRLRVTRGARGASSSESRVHRPGRLRNSTQHAARGEEAARSTQRGSSTQHPAFSPSSRSVLRVVVEKGGLHQSVEVCCAIDMARRLCAHPEVPDRRGVAPRNRRGERIITANAKPGARSAEGRGSPGSRARSPEERRSPADVSAGHEPRGAVLARKRRCAEPVVRRDQFLLGGGCRR